VADVLSSVDNVTREQQAMRQAVEAFLSKVQAI
jgi:hypothetical protein